MFNTTTLPPSHICFENPVGRLLEHPTGLYIAIELAAGPRQFSELWTFITQAGQLLARWGWDTLLTYNRQTIVNLTAEETSLLITHWQQQTSHSLALLYGAQLLPHEVFARLSWHSLEPARAR